MNSKSFVLGAALAGIMATAHAADKNDKSAATQVVEATGECSGVNSCKGKGECGSKDHSCAGLNTCKGKGWVTTTEKDCLTKKGKWKPG